MSANIIFRLHIGPMVEIQIEGANCHEISEALEGYERLNKQVEGMCSGLAENAYPDTGEESADHGGAQNQTPGADHHETSPDHDTHHNHPVPHEHHEHFQHDSGPAWRKASRAKAPDKSKGARS